MPVDATHVLHDGPWRHRFVAANGARFHVAEAGDGPLVVLLHGFPQMWWAWRHQIPGLAGAGHRVAALDLRGYGASDKPPRGYDTPTLAADVAAVIRSLGASQATIVGHGWGGWIAWSMPSLEPDVTTAVAALSMPHPARMRSVAVRSSAQRRALRRIWGYQRPITPERRLARDGTAVARLLREGSGRDWLDGDAGTLVLQRYADAMAVPFVAYAAMEYFRWVVRSQPRRDGRAFRDAVRHPVQVPVLQLQGALDPWVLATTARGSEEHTSGPYEYVELDAGHFLPEEAPDEVTDALLRWLDALPPVPPAT